MAKNQVRAVVDVECGCSGKMIPAGTIGEHITTQLVPPYHMLVKWKGNASPCDTDPKKVERI